MEVNEKRAEWKQEKEKQMKKIVDNKLYDTDTAESLGEWRHTFRRHSLYRTKKGAFFVVTTS